MLANTRPAAEPGAWRVAACRLALHKRLSRERFHETARLLSGRYELHINANELLEVRPAKLTGRMLSEYRAEGTLEAEGRGDIALLTEAVGLCKRESYMVLETGVPRTESYNALEISPGGKVRMIHESPWRLQGDPPTRTMRAAVPGAVLDAMRALAGARGALDESAVGALLEAAGGAGPRAPWRPEGALDAVAEAEFPDKVKMVLRAGRVPGEAGSGCASVQLEAPDGGSTPIVPVKADEIKGMHTVEMCPDTTSGNPRRPCLCT